MNAEVDRTEIERILALLHLEDRREVVRYCRRLVISCEALFQVIVAGRHAGLHPYVYDCHFSTDDSSEPEAISAADRDLVALAANDLVPLHRRARKAAHRIAQSFEQPESFAAHLLYTPSHRNWHLFCFERELHASTTRVRYSRAGVDRRPLQQIWRDLCRHQGVPRSIPIRYDCLWERQAASVVQVVAETA